MEGVFCFGGPGGGIDGRLWMVDGVRGQGFWF